MIGSFRTINEAFFLHGKTSLPFFHSHGWRFLYIVIYDCDGRFSSCYRVILYSCNFLLHSLLASITKQRVLGTPFPCLSLAWFLHYLLLRSRSLLSPHLKLCRVEVSEELLWWITANKPSTASPLHQRALSNKETSLPANGTGNHINIPVKATEFQSSWACNQNSPVPSRNSNTLSLAPYYTTISPMSTVVPPHNQTPVHAHFLMAACSSRTIKIHVLPSLVIPATPIVTKCTTYQTIIGRRKLASMAITTWSCSCVLLIVLAKWYFGSFRLSRLRRISCWAFEKKKKFNCSPDAWSLCFYFLLQFIRATWTVWFSWCCKVLLSFGRW